jgi:hypothetical protein
VTIYPKILNPFATDVGIASELTMSNAQPGGDVSQRGPGEYLDPLAPLSSQFQQLESLLELVFDDYEAFVQGLIEDVLSLPPEERFTRSHEVLREHIEDRFGSTDAFAALLPQSDPEKLPAVLRQLFERVLADVLEGVFFQREPEDNLVLVAIFQTLSDSVHRLETTDEQEIRDRVASTMLALLSRLQNVLDDAPKSLPDEAVWDTARGLHYATAEDSGPDVPDPEELSFDEAKHQVIKFGAVIAYARLNISLSRAAELADVPSGEFRSTLDRYDIEPRFGPNAVEELYDDGTDE